MPKKQKIPLPTTLEELIAEKSALSKEMSSIQKKMKPLKKAIDIASDRYSDVIDAIDKLELADPDLRTDWKFLLDIKNNGRGTDFYRLLSDSMFKTWNFWVDGMWDDTHQRSLKLMLKKGDPASLALTLKGINTLTPFLIPHKDNWDRWGIFEGSNSSGVFELWYNRNINEAKVIHFYYREEKNLFQGSLEDAVKYVQNYLPYSGGSDNDDKDMLQFGY